MSSYKRGQYAKTHQSFCLWCGKEIQTKKEIDMFDLDTLATPDGYKEVTKMFFISR